MHNGSLLLQGAFEYRLPSDPENVAEARRDFLRTLSAGGVTVLTASSRQEMNRRRDRRPDVEGKAVDISPGEVTAEAVKLGVADFREQLLEIVEQEMNSDSLTPTASSPGSVHVPGETHAEAASTFSRMRHVIDTGILEGNLTVGPALRFLAVVRLMPRILQPHFGIVVGPRQLRVATLGYVGEPLLGDRPADKRTPFITCMQTQNLFDFDAPASPDGQVVVQITYKVRRASHTESSILDCLSNEAASLVSHLDGTCCPMRFLTTNRRPHRPAVAGVSIPSATLDGPRNLITYHVRIVPADGAAPREVLRRFEDFQDLYRRVRPSASVLVKMCFPRRRLLQVNERQFEKRRRGLEVWLMEVVREAQCQDRDWQVPLQDFFWNGPVNTRETPGRFRAAHN